MQINYFTKPVPYMVIDNFLGVKNNNHLLTMIAAVEDKMIDAEIIDHGTRRIDHGFRKNLNLWLDTFDNDTVGMMSVFTEKFFHPDIEQAVSKIPELSHFVGAHSRNYNMILSRYHSSDFYKWHTDGGGHVTWNYFCYQTPKQFAGGDFALSNGLYQQERPETTTIECVNDRLVIFPAMYQHSVTAVAAEDNLNGLDCRHSIQIFFS
jgi:Rps23 Pro-64 3,4-dihydroxylase Tpa1-like proline 4-hydroxylase